MSQKTLKHTTTTTMKIDPEVTTVPDEYVVKVGDRGARIYSEAIHSLVQRFSGGPLKGDPQQLAQAVIHQVIAFVAQVVPLTASGKPVDGAELSAIFGAAVGMAAAAAVDKGQASIPEVESMTDCFYVALREAVPRGIAVVRAVDAKRLVMH
jgi:hypothetical protein